MMFEFGLWFSLAVLVLGMIFLLQGPPFVPSDDESVQQILELANDLKPARILDMGSGDGRIVIALAKEGFRVDGVELNLFLVWYSRWKVRQAGVSEKVTVKWGSFWNYDTSNYSLVVLYAVQHIMLPLEKKLRNELRPGTPIISNYFDFPGLRIKKSKSRVQMYRI
jgi:16S rRNA A1518/A1519 N6-dimethyltransferase RsmA/KsgA/DIM1 with predicted DNA glycosylase/AP lyase activity